MRRLNGPPCIAATVAVVVAPDSGAERQGVTTTRRGRLGGAPRSSMPPEPESEPLRLSDRRTT